MPFRRLPDSDATRTHALSSAGRKLATTEPADRLISDETAAALLTLLPGWTKETQDRGEALASQAAATASLNTAAGALRLLISHFIQVYNMAIARGDFSVSGRAHYQLPVSEETVPTLHTEADLLLWAERVIAGDSARVAALAEDPMSNPSAARVSTALAAYLQILATQTAAKDKHDTEQADVAALRPEADRLIKDAWDEIEFALRRLDPPSLRRRAREWGVHYALRPGEPEETPAPEEPENPTGPAA